jgi:hypothetical protein
MEDQAGYIWQFAALNRAWYTEVIHRQRIWKNTSTGVPGVDGDQRGQLNVVSVLLAEVGGDLCEDHVQ